VFCLLDQLQKRKRKQEDTDVDITSTEEGNDLYITLMRSNGNILVSKKLKPVKDIHKKKTVQVKSPKQSRSAFTFFCTEMRKCYTGPRMTVPAFTRQVAQTWAQMSKEEREPFAQCAVLDKQRYEKQKKQGREKGYWTE